MNAHRLTELNVFTGRCSGCFEIKPLTVRYMSPGSTFFVCSADCWDQNYSAVLGPLDDGPVPLDADVLRCDNCDAAIPDRKREHEREFCSTDCICAFHSRRREADQTRRLERLINAMNVAVKFFDGPPPGSKAPTVSGNGYARAVPGDLARAPEPVGPDSFGGEDYSGFPLGDDPALGSDNLCPVCDRRRGDQRIAVDDWIVCSLSCRERFIREKEKRETEQAARKANAEFRTAGIIKAADELGRVWDSIGGTARALIAAGSPELYEAIADLVNRVWDKTK